MRTEISYANNPTAASEKEVIIEHYCLSPVSLSVAVSNPLFSVGPAGAIFSVHIWMVLLDL